MSDTGPNAVRAGAHIVFRDIGGLRHLVRVASIICISDTDETMSESVVQLPGGRLIVVAMPFEPLATMVAVDRDPIRP